MAKRGWEADTQTFAEAAAAKSERTRALLAQLQERRTAGHPTMACAKESDALESGDIQDADYGILNKKPNDDLLRVSRLFDLVDSSPHAIHAALLWPHVPPRSILPWMLREVSRGRRSRPLRTLFMNMSRSALQAISGVEASTSRLRARGVFRSERDGDATPIREIGADAHFFMFLGGTKESPPFIPLISIVPHAVALDDGTYWRDFDEKTLKGMKRYFSLPRLNSIRKYLDVLTSKDKGPGFAFLMPSHFEGPSRKAALQKLASPIDLVVIDLGIQALGGRNVSALVTDLLSELEQHLAAPPKRILVLSDCPLRFGYACRAIKNRQEPGPIGSRVTLHRLVWTSRDRGFRPLQPLAAASFPRVETVASEESVVAARLWTSAQKLDDDNPLKAVLQNGAAALKGMALTASGADAMLKPYGDTHDFYHRIKQKRHSFDPHYAEAMALIGERHGGAWRDEIQSDLEEALSLAGALRTDTPIMRYLKRCLTEASSDEDILVVLRHPEDAQQTTDALLEFLTAPGNFVGSIQNLRVTTPSRYAAELEANVPTTVIWAASANAGMRSYIGDSFAPHAFHLVVAGHDSLTLKNSLEQVSEYTEYATYRDRTVMLMKALPRAPKELGSVRTAFGLDPDRPRGLLPFTGHGYLLLDGYGRVGANPGTLFYVLDPVSQQLHPHEARSIEVGDSVFVMSDAIREEIEALLREKDEQGRTLEQSLVDQYKGLVRLGIENLSRKEGKRITGSRIHEMLFEANPNLPSIGKQAVEYWLQAADHTHVDTPFAAMNPVHFEAFLKILGAGIMARQLSDAVRVVRSALQRDGHTNRALFDRLLLDADSLIQTKRRVTYERLQSLRAEALENVFPVLEVHLEVAADNKGSDARMERMSA